LEVVFPLAFGVNCSRNVTGAGALLPYSVRLTRGSEGGMTVSRRAYLLPPLALMAGVLLASELGLLLANRSQPGGPIFPIETEV
jgi:hypothetical protein